jgi:hypothetical protein
VHGVELVLPSIKSSSEADKNGSNLALTSGQYRDARIENNGVIFTELNIALKKLEI